MNITDILLLKLEKCQHRSNLPGIRYIYPMLLLSHIFAHNWNYISLIDSHCNTESETSDSVAFDRHHWCSFRVHCLAFSDTRFFPLGLDYDWYFQKSFSILFLFVHVHSCISRVLTHGGKSNLKPSFFLDKDTFKHNVYLCIFKNVVYSNKYWCSQLFSQLCELLSR